VKIGITTFGCDNGRSGIGRYLHRHLVEFHRFGLSPHIFCTTSDHEMLPREFRRHELSPRWDHPVANLLLHQTWLPARSRELDVLFLPAANRRLPCFSGCPTVGTVHDLAVAKLEGKYDPGRTFYVSRVLPKLIKKLDHVITVSEASKRDIVELTGIAPEKISVTPLGVDHTRYYPQNSDLELSRFGIRKPFLLYVSRIEHPGKNHQQLLRAFDNLKKKLRIPHQLVLVGSDWKGAGDVHALARTLPSRDDIVFTGFFPEEHLPQLYNQAELLVFPSLYEGFGLPILEAMACGLPVVSSNRASLPEVVGDAGLLFDPDLEGSLEQNIGQVLESPTNRQRLSAAGRLHSLKFDWSTTAAKTLEILHSVARGAPPSHTQNKQERTSKCA
jgi:glycosyltransferase involved in cell wall biosynthesis